MMATVITQTVRTFPRIVEATDAYLTELAGRNAEKLLSGPRIIPAAEEQKPGDREESDAASRTRLATVEMASAVGATIQRAAPGYFCNLTSSLGLPYTTGTPQNPTGEQFLGN